MNNYAPGLFRKLDESETDTFRKDAEDTFNKAEDILEVKALFHPAWRKRIGELLIEQADAELLVMGMEVR